MNPQLRAVITGASSGLGRALALDVARRGGQVVIADINEHGAHETAQAVERAGARAHVVLCDVRHAEQVDELAARAREHMGEVDLVANNAGVAVGGMFSEVPLDDWQWIMDINLWGVIYGCRAFLPAMQARGRGYVINIASAAGFFSAPGMAPYNVTKAGVIALSETLYGESKPYGVHVSVVCPTFFKTNIMQASRSPELQSAAEYVERAMERSRVQAPDVARASIDAVLRGQLYVMPMRDGRVMWRFKRAAPDMFYKLLSGPLWERLARRIRGE